MSRSYVHLMQKFVEPLTPKNRKLLSNLAEIVMYATDNSGIVPKKTVDCWYTKNRKQCKGKIDAGIELQNQAIMWHCLVCGQNGVIHQWRETVWNKL